MHLNYVPNTVRYLMANINTTLQGPMLGSQSCRGVLWVAASWTGTVLSIEAGVLMYMYEV